MPGSTGRPRAAALFNGVSAAAISAATLTATVLLHPGHAAAAADASVAGRSALDQVAQAQPASPQPAQAQARGPEQEIEEIVVTGFRGSLASALAQKKNENSFVDVINAEDIADFPDLNLAESLQRIPGVAIDRDGGEGRSITVRGLSSDFTRVRLNGLEALATTGGKDGSGGANRGRGFDFQIFASELFSNITVRKSQSAETEEGSLGATVDLRTAKPFDYDGLALAASGQYGYNDLSEKFDPRGTILFSDRFFGDKLGVLFSLAYTKRNLLEEGSSTVRWENPSVAGNSAGRFETVPAGLDAQNAWHPRIPRYGRLSYDQDRLGATGAIQFRPVETTTITLDGLYAKLDGTRQEEYLQVISFSRSGQGNPRTDVRAGRIGPDGTLVAGTFDDVDVRTEQRRDELETEFKQYSIGIEHEFSDRFRVSALLGHSESVQDNPVQTTLSLDRYDSDGYSYDFSDPNLPAFVYGFDVTNPANWTFSPSAALGDASLIRMRPNRTDNTFDTVRADAAFDLSDWVTLKVGGLYKEYTFETVELRRFTIGGITEGAVALPPGVTIASISELVTGFGRNLDLPGGTPTSWLVPSIDRVADVLGIYCNCVNQYGDFRLSADNQRGNNRAVSEDSLSGYIQADIETQFMGRTLRGDFGVRWVETEVASSGFTGTRFVTVDQDYRKTLPAMNLVYEPMDDVFVRFGAAKVMSRPQLPSMTPGGSINVTARTLNIGNPLLKPIEADTVDLGFEWYPSSEALVSVGLFYKDIKTYVQSVTETVAFADTGLPSSLLPAGQSPNDIYTVTRAANTEGGPLKGFEISLQTPFTFLPEMFQNFGVIANYTYVESDIEYVVATNRTVVEPLVNLSPNSWNLTLYYEDERFSARISGAYRDEYLTGVPGGNGNDVRGKAETFNLDFSASYEVTDQITVTFEAINLTDQFDERWISRQRQNMESYEHTGRQYYLGARWRY